MAGIYIRPSARPKKRKRHPKARAERLLETAEGFGEAAGELSDAQDELAAMEWPDPLADVLFASKAARDLAHNAGLTPEDLSNATPSHSGGGYTAADIRRLTRGDTDAVSDE